MSSKMVVVSVIFASLPLCWPRKCGHLQLHRECCADHVTCKLRSSLPLPAPSSWVSAVDLVTCTIFCLKSTACPWAALRCLSFIFSFSSPTSLSPVLLSFTSPPSRWGFCFVLTICGTKGWPGVCPLVVPGSRSCTFAASASLGPPSFGAGPSGIVNSPVTFQRTGQGTALGCTYPVVCLLWLVVCGGSQGQVR